MCVCVCVCVYIYRWSIGEASLLLLGLIWSFVLISYMYDEGEVLGSFTHARLHPSHMWNPIIVGSISTPYMCSHRRWANAWSQLMHHALVPLLTYDLIDLCPLNSKSMRPKSKHRLNFTCYCHHINSKHGWHHKEWKAQVTDSTCQMESQFTIHIQQMHP